MSSFTIEGEWTGYTMAQRHVVHREHTRSKKRAEDIRALHCIHYTDGTSLILRVLDGKKDRAIDGYSSLINSCLAQGVNSVADLND